MYKHFMAGGTQQDRKRLRSLLRQLRKDAELRQVDVAERLKRPQSFVSKYESGEKMLDILETKEICETLGIQFSDFAKKLEKLT